MWRMRKNKWHSCETMQLLLSYDQVMNDPSASVPDDNDDDVALVQMRPRSELEALNTKCERVKWMHANTQIRRQNCIKFTSAAEYVWQCPYLKSECTIVNFVRKSGRERFATQRINIFVALFSDAKLKVLAHIFLIMCHKASVFRKRDSTIKLCIIISQQNTNDASSRKWTTRHARSVDTKVTK